MQYYHDYGMIHVHSVKVVCLIGIFELIPDGGAASSSQCKESLCCYHGMSLNH